MKKAKTVKVDKLRRGYKQEVYLTPEQKALVEKHFELERQVFNWALGTSIAFYEMPLEEQVTWLAAHGLREKKVVEGKKLSLNRYDLQTLLLEFKKEQPELLEVHAQSLIIVLFVWERAMQAFFRRLKNGETAGFPHFKKYGTYTSMMRQCPLTASRETFIPNERTLWFSSKIGTLHTVAPENRAFRLPERHRNQRPIPPNAILKTMTISRENNRYYVSFSVIEGEPIDHIPEEGTEVEITFAPQDDDIFFTTSLGRAEMKPKFILRYEKEIGRIQRGWKRDQKLIEKEKIEVLKNLQPLDELKAEEIGKAFVEKTRARHKQYLWDINTKFRHIKNRRADYIGTLVAYYIRTFRKITITVPRFSEELSHSKTRLPPKREHNKILNDSSGYAFFMALKNKSQELGFKLEAILQEKEKKTS